MVLWFLVVTGQPLIPKEVGWKGVKNNGELLTEESLKQETVKTLTRHEEQYIATHNNTSLSWPSCFPSPILWWAGETGARSSSSWTMGKEASPFAQELGWSEIFLHCSRERGGRLQPLLFSSNLPSMRHTAQPGRWKGWGVWNEDLEPWGL